MKEVLEEVGEDLAGTNEALHPEKEERALRDSQEKLREAFQEGRKELNNHPKKGTMW